MKTLGGSDCLPIIDPSDSMGLLVPDITLADHVIKKNGH